MAANMYRVGDYVFFETSSTSPYQIRRIEELCKTVNGNVEAKVMCFYRRRDISASLIQLADKHQNMMEEDNEDGIRLTKEDLSDKQQHQIRHRELFLSRQVETLPATHIRGKCSVTLLNETESLMAYLNCEDSFFYSLVYDPQQKTLLADKGEIRVGARYQAEPVPPVLAEGESDDRTLAELEELRWNPTGIEDDKIIDSFLIIARSVGTFARALDCTSTVRQPSLHISAAAASRDITLFNAMDMLHKANYNVSSAIASLVPRTGPILCRDEMEEWSASEANLFEEALDKYGKDFADIQRDYLPWKTMKSIIEYYYMWKTTDRYVQQKRVKAAESEGKLKQVYIPNYNKPNPAKIVDKVTGTDGLYQYACEGCYTTHSSEWFAWGPAQMQCRLCASCWTYWKKFGGLRMPTRLDGGNQGDRAVHAVSLGVHKCSISGCGKEYRVRSQLLRHLAASHGLITGPGSPCTAMKTRAAFCLVTTPLTRISRRLCRNLFNIRRAARRPFLPVNVALIKQECQQRLPDLAKGLHVAKVKKRIPMEDVSARLGVDIATAKPILLQHNISAAVAASLSTSEDQPTTRCAFVETPDDSVVRSHALTVTTSSRAHSANGQSQSKRKRSYEHINGIEDAPVAKLSSSGIIQSCSTNRSLSDSNPKNHVKAVVRVNGKGSRDSVVGRSRKHILNWVDTPDDVYYVASQAVKKLRYQMPVSQLKQAARQPCSRILSSTDSSVAVKSVQLGTNMVAKQSDSVVILS